MFTLSWWMIAGLYISVASCVYIIGSYFQADEESLTAFSFFWPIILPLGAVLIVVCVPIYSVEFAGKYFRNLGKAETIVKDED